MKLHSFLFTLTLNCMVIQFILAICVPSLVVVQVTKGKEELPFYSVPEFEEWKEATSNWHTWKIKYYKGLHSKLTLYLQVLWPSGGGMHIQYSKVRL